MLDDTVTTRPKEEKISFAAYLAAIYFACVPLYFVGLPSGISILKYLSFIIGGLLIINLFVGEKHEIRFNAIHLFLALYLVYSVSSFYIYRTPNAMVTFRALVETSLMIFLISIRIYNQKEMKMFHYCWVAAGVFICILMLISGVQIGEERISVGIGGFNEDPNQLCGYFILPLCFCIERIKEKSKYWIFYAGFFLIMLYLSFETGSRGGMVAIFITILTYAIFAFYGGMYRKIQVIIAVLMICFISFYVILPIMPQNIQDRMTVQSVMEDEGSGRFEIWKVEYKAIMQDARALFFGYGLDSTKDILAKGGLTNIVAHNHWLQLWCDQGFIGMMLFFILFLIGFFRNWNKNRAICVSIVGMLALSMSLTMYAYYKPFWNILLMAAINLTGENGDLNAEESQCYNNSL